jgi:hypothetical protein
MEREGRRGAGNPETGSIEWRESNAADRRGNWFASFSLRPVRMSSEITSTGLVDSPGLADNPGFAGSPALPATKLWPTIQLWPATKLWPAVQLWPKALVF